MTRELLKKCIPKITDANLDRYWSRMSVVLEKYKIDTPLRQAHFFSQIGHESLDLSVTVENLNYTANQLLKTFPKYFKTLEQANGYAKQPEKIANFVYGGRYGNFNPGDGWLYRGRGPMMITFYDNYKALGEALDYDFIKNPDDLLKPGASCYSAGWYWDSRALNKLADKDDGLAIRKKINGGTNGLEDCIKRLTICKKALGI